MSLKKLSKLKPAKYRFTDPTKGETDRLSMGIMAQDIEEVWPHEKYSVLHKDTQGYYSVDYTQLMAPMLKAIQELSTKVEELEKKINK